MLIGVTGVIGSGKTTVASLFEELGCGVIYADKLTHDLLENDPEIYQRITTEWGEREIIDKDGRINRKKLSEIVFTNKQELEKLNKIMHPIIYKKYKEKLDKLKREGYPIIIYDAPLLIELSLYKEMDKVIVVIAEEKLIFERLKKRGMSETEIKLRLEAQLPQHEKLKYGDFVIENNGTLEELRYNVINLWKILMNEI